MRAQRFFSFTDFAFINLLIYQLVARCEIKFILRASLIAGALCMAACATQGIKFRAAKSAKSARSVRRKILYRQPARAAQNFKILLKF